jgi:hypothetical protein
MVDLATKSASRRKTAGIRKVCIEFGVDFRLRKLAQKISAKLANPPKNEYLE